MVCKICQDLLYGHKHRIGSGSQLQLKFWHHEKEENVRDSAEETGCYICGVIYDRLKILNMKRLGQAQNQADGEFLSASLRPFPGSKQSGLYRLDFKVKNAKDFIASFVLKRNDAGEPAAGQASPTSTNTLDSGVFTLAKSWIEECAQSHEKCCTISATSRPAWHPTRLIDLKSMLAPNNLTEAVRLVSQQDSERRAGQPEIEGAYVTLSHRWGEGGFAKLTRDTLLAFQNAILLSQLPLTFQHAIKFACELNVRWLWIDALCILQGDSKDWLIESAKMDKVYTHSYCNISATAAMDSSQGLFYNRDKSRRWFEDVTLRTTDLKEDPKDTVRCTISDLSFWATYVENAPANRRAWVFQERLLAPRVIHWCKDQIAFECRELDRAECRPEGIPHFQIKGGKLVNEARLKGIDKEIGKQLREIRLASKHRASSSVEEVDSKFFFYEIWKRVVEEYTKMELSQEQDRLIALSGIARMMFSTMKAEGINDVYIAGMWQNYIASQLLWYVNEGEGDSRQPFENTRTAEYRAPTFSWASVETGRGVTFAETTNEGLLVQIQVVRLSYKTEDDTFGLLTDGYLVLKGVLRKIVMTDRARSAQPPASGWAYIDELKVSKRVLTVVACACFLPILINFMLYGFTYLKQGWTFFIILATCGVVDVSMLVGRTLHGQKIHKTSVDDGKNRYSWRLTDSPPFSQGFENVYLDSPASAPSVFGPEARLYCLPVLEDNWNLTCLLVQAIDGKHGAQYKRVGLTKVLKIYPDVSDIKEPPGNNENTFGRYYWGPDGKVGGESTICII